MQPPRTLLNRLFPPTPPSTTTTWQRADPVPSARLPHPRPSFKIGQRVYNKAHYDAESNLQQQSYWIKGWRWDQVYGQMRYLLTYTPNGQVYGSEAEGSLLVA
ncbi:hypothetical protein HO133_009250 [Letharia lupina]|uniref:Uncharacterized protein n=2 Tax=Letharia TaxID=112415 RepID=A0A8H6FFX2_9LECA|nr:uncharacterized protein HO133_009250 [Letharia lupina]XP_037166878.1 uncharacterized protein HO173_004444 [Letharia columbiana]KAF6226384.1 hypothetical protein HO133_009250 [Letharia lupina]KAF6237554.1 hypothetical protein HO173_004444 [Letharia columbiana]